MKIGIPNKRFSSYTRAWKPKAWKVIEIDYKIIPIDLPLSDKALTLWQRDKLPTIGYRNFHGLSITDIKTILSAVKRQEARVNVNRWGVCAYYKLLPKREQKA